MTQTNDDLTGYDCEPYAYMLSMFAMFFQFGGPVGGPFFARVFSTDLRGKNPISNRTAALNELTGIGDGGWP